MDSLFYAYLCVQTPDTLTLASQRVVMVFSNRAAADEWWRFVSAPDEDTTFTSAMAHLFSESCFSVRRISPQFYMCGSSNPHILDRLFTEKTICDKFKSRMFVAPEVLYSPLGSAIPSQPIIDHFSGNWFRIRARDDSSVIFWHWMRTDHESKITLTNDPSQASSFRIIGCHVREGTVLIGTDTIRIQLEDSENPTYIDRQALGNDDSSMRGTTGNAAEFLFSDLFDDTTMPNREYVYVDLEAGQFVLSNRKKSGRRHYGWELVY